MFAAYFLQSGRSWDFRAVFPHGFLYWLLLGLVAGWLAGKIARGRGFGCIADIVLGLIGSYIGGWVFVKLGIFGGGFWYSLAAATLGAVILVAIAHLFSGGHDH
ncbi:MAG TPA: GlsB/YeaQ/YmgE family stress response membrane protein [Candidatus Acidoferrum sp.]|nr:GlsB/YeaQ/YmgE family stress response membrane protein [Candidatus Acidoferrum sp.]